MVAAHGIPTVLRRWRLDWRAVAVVALIHAALVAWLVSSRWVPSALGPSTAMVLIHLWEPPVRNEASEPAGSAAAAPRVAAAPKKAAASPRPAERRRPDRSIVVPEGRDSVETGTDARETVAVASTTPVSDGAPSSFAVGEEASGARPRFKAPRVTRRVIPEYPSAAFRAGQQGRVDVIVTIAADGRPVDARVYQSSGSPGLDAASIDAALAYGYQPGRRGDTPVESQGIVTIDWKIGPETIEHVAGTSPAPAAEQAERARRECMGNIAHDVSLRRNAALCGPVKRR